MAFLKKHFMEQISSIPSNHADSPWSIGVLTVGSFRNPHGSSSQLPRIPVDLQTSPRYERLQHGLSTWFSLRSDCHRLVSSLPNDFICLPCPQWMAMDMGISPALQLLHPLVQAGPTCSPPSFPFFLVPSFLCPTELCMDPDIPSQCSGSPSRAHLVSVGTAASLDIPDPLWREVNPTSTHHSGILSTLICAHIRNEFPFH